MKVKDGDRLNFEGLIEVPVIVTMRNGEIFEGIVGCVFDDILVLYSDLKIDREKFLGDIMLSTRYIVSVEINEPREIAEKRPMGFFEREFRKAEPES